MQAHSSIYDIIIAGGLYSVENRIDMYDRPTKNEASKLTVALSSAHPPAGGLLINKGRWESNPKYGSRNGTFIFTYVSGTWYYNYGRTGQEALSGSIQSLGITQAGRGTWQWANGDIITVTRYEKTRQLIHTFYADEIISINPTWNVFTQDTPGIGGCYSAQNRIQLRTANTNVPTMAEFRVFKRIYNQSRTSEWLAHGTFYVDTREPDSDLGTTSFVCYDAMLMTEQIYRELSGITTWPAADTQVIQEICSLIGIGFDSREWNTAFASKVDYPNDKTMREILGEITAAHCGNFVISYENQLRFVPFQGSGGNNIYSLDSKWEEFELQEPFKPYRQVNLWYDDEHAFSYPYPILDGDAWDDSPLGKTNGDFALVYTEEDGNPRWKYGDTVIRLGDCGISYIGQPMEGDIIQITRDQDISIRAQRDGRTDDIPVNLTVWDMSDLGGHNGTYAFQYIDDPETPGSAGWYYGDERVSLSAYGISFSGNSENGDSIKVIRFNGERPAAQVSSDNTGLSLSIDVDAWEDSSYGGVDGTYRFTYQNTVKITQQQSGTLVPIPLSAANMNRWDSEMGTTDGTYVLTYQNRIWTLTSGPSEDIGSSYILANIGLSFSGIPQNGDTITVIRDGAQKAWRDGAITVNMTTLGISISGAISIDDIIYVRRYMETVNDISGTVRTRDISLEIDIDSWEKTGLGKKDGEYIFRYNGTTRSWTYYTGGILVPITLSEYGIHYDLVPDNLDTITITRDSGLTDINAYAVVSDRILNGNCSWATQEMANRIYGEIYGYIYRPYSASSVLLNPAMEPGDKIKRTDTDALSYILGSIDADQDILYSADISAPTDEEVNHEYEYKSQTQKDLSRKVTLGEFYYGTSISREKGIFIERSDGQSEAIFNSDVFAMRSMVDGVMQDRVYFDPQKGEYIFAGSLAADAVFTESLYAEQGVIAELTVDRLTTSRRIREYLLDTYYRPEPIYAEDNYIQIQDYHIKWITGSVNKDENENPIIIQAIDRNGDPLFWDGLVRSCTGEGYPLDEDGNQLYTTATNTGFPVLTYQYTEFAKMQGLFESDGTNYAPRMIFGTGDQNGNNICYIYKATDGLHIDYKTTDGTTDSIIHYENEPLWRLNGIGIAPVDSMPEDPLQNVIYLTPEE